MAIAIQIPVTTKGLTLKENITTFLRAHESDRRNGLRVNQAVALQHGALSGLSGALVDFRDNHRCLIELDDVQGGVFLVVDCAALKDTSQPKPTN